MQNQQNIALNLTLEEVNTILNALGDRPYVQVFELVQNIQQQAGTQVAQQSEIDTGDNGKLVPVSELDGSRDFKELTDLLKERKQTNELTAIIKDEEKCIRCALCAIRCPSLAITMERFSFTECLT